MDKLFHPTKCFFRYDEEDWGRRTGHVISQRVAKVTSSRQIIEILDDVRYGLSLWITERKRGAKSSIQFASVDEFRYHEMVLAALLLHPRPRRILNLGGADLFLAARELFVKSVKYVKIADWDRKVMEVVLEHVPLIHEFVAPKNQWIDFSKELDVTTWLPRARGSYDLIVNDVTQPTLMARMIPTFALHVARLLAPGGIFMSLAGEFDLAEGPLQDLRENIAHLSEHFPCVRLAKTQIGSFTGAWAFTYAWKDQIVDPLAHIPSQEEIEARLYPWALRHVRYYDPDTHREIFTIPRDMQAALAIKR